MRLVIMTIEPRMAGTNLRNVTAYSKACMKCKTVSFLKHTALTQAD